MNHLARVTDRLCYTEAVVQRLVVESVEIGERISHALANLSLDGVVIILGALGEDVFVAARFTGMEKPVAVEIVRLKEFDPEKIECLKVRIDILNY